MKPILLIDTYAQIYRSYYAIRELKSKDGYPINALFGMAKFLLKINTEYADYNGVFVADLGKPAHRLALAPDYKANRPPMPPELKGQLPDIFRLIQAFGWQIHAHETWEADDLLSAFTITFPDCLFFILSKDKDLAQLINEHVFMLVPSHDNGGFELRDAVKTQEKFGVTPEQIVDYLCLLGDNADNIPGIAGIGEKTAAKLLQQYGSLENILENVDNIKGKSLQEALRNGRERLAINRKLICLQQVLPPEFSNNIELFERKEPDYPLILEIAQSYQLHSIVKEIQNLISSGKNTANTCMEDDLFSFMQTKAIGTQNEDLQNKHKQGNLFQAELFESWEV